MNIDQDSGDISRSEAVIARAARRFLEPLPVGALVEGDVANDMFNGLEYFLPEILRECYKYWEHESLDRFFAAWCRKKATYALELPGVCILISDQTLTPMHVRLEISPTTDQIVWMECRLGAPGDGAGGMARTPYGKWRGIPLVASVTNADAIRYVYKVTFGVKNCHINWDE